MDRWLTMLLMHDPIIRRDDELMKAIPMDFGIIQGPIIILEHDPMASIDLNLI